MLSAERPAGCRIREEEKDFIKQLKISIIVFSPAAFERVSREREFQEGKRGA
jgi:hypothetical protein